MNYFISDLHYGHANAINFDKRPFDSVEEMNQAIIENINSTVRRNDDLYIIGDIALRANLAIECAQQINCRMHLILGNHDYEKEMRDSGLFVEITNYKRIVAQPSETGLSVSVPIIMCHYPIMSWDRQRYGAIHLYGHVHTQSPYIFDFNVDGERVCKKFSLDQIPNAYNVFCGFQGFRPWTIKELMDTYGYYPDIYMVN